MAFGVNRQQLAAWKSKVSRGEIAFLTHYWVDERFPGIRTVTKVGCRDIRKLRNWCLSHQLNPAYIHMRDEYPHFDLIGPRQKEILMKEQLWDQIERFKLWLRGVAASDQHDDMGDLRGGGHLDPVPGRIIFHGAGTDADDLLRPKGIEDIIGQRAHAFVSFLAVHVQPICTFHLQKLVTILDGLDRSSQFLTDVSVFPIESDAHGSRSFLSERT